MRTFSKVISFLAAFAMAFLLVGCGGSQEKEVTPGFDAREIEVNQAGFTIDKDGLVRYAFVAINPNDGYVGKNVTFTVEGFDEDGKLILGGGTTISALYPQVETGAAGSVELYSRDGSIPKVSAFNIKPVMSTIEWNTTTVTNEEVDTSVNSQNAHYSIASDGTLNSSVKLVTEKEKLDLRVIVLLEDEQGASICGSEPVVVQVGTATPNTGEHTVNISIPDAPPFATCTVYCTYE